MYSSLNQTGYVSQGWRTLGHGDYAAQWIVRLRLGDSDVIGDRPCKSTSPSKCEEVDDFDLPPEFQHVIPLPVNTYASCAKACSRRSSLLACAFPCGSPHRMTTMRAPGQTLHHGPRVICAKRATYVEILRQSCKEVKKTWEKVSPSCGIHKWPTR